MKLLSLDSSLEKKTVFWLCFWHIVVIISSNYLVQFPFRIGPYHTTWGAFTFPFIFLTTDLTVRLVGRDIARRIIFMAMVPSWLISYLISVWFHDGQWQGWSALSEFHSFAFRIAFASFAAYVTGQLLDIYVFNRLRQLKSWWVAPSASTIAGNALDTVVFFAVAFYASSDPYMAAHWVDIAWVDYVWKIVISGLLFLPAYGVLLKFLMRQLKSK
ncbi:7-cyano-7-deazaguanine/7-aminomethyl-7-deazaguanine transporter [Basilea psittacipulmonis]|uniref:Probable queuosine precursor transporter n=1 Tax=Basilea psittacipulmonis DSM 24701 TaxID=1072685 RepID=A0A077DAP7_9BURK|nr:7-cyano-7-deazaguanine/7-aminomethyl-7-deazaguanine transporter [Basilea psittacipulmonis]AIL31970.1 hypothetical protein IX83_00310 [Basilea psittacipulmonis DSM 24701]